MENWSYLENGEISGHGYY